LCSPLYPVYLVWRCRAVCAAEHTSCARSGLSGKGGCGGAATD